MENPITLSSSTIRQFGFGILFDLFAKNIVISPAALTTVVNTGSGIASLVISITDPTGYKYAQKAVNPVTLAPVSFDTGNIFNFGIFTITGTVTDSDGKVFEISVSKNICIPDGWKAGKVIGEFKIDVDCKIPSVTVSEVTKFNYSAKGPSSVTKSGSIFYPNNLLDQLDFLFTPFNFGSDIGVYTGNYTVRNTTYAVYDLNDSVTVKIPYVTRQEFDVVCEDSFADILCCINEQYEIIKNNPNTTLSTGAKSKLTEITPDLMLAIINDRTAKSAADQLARIKLVLNCDCNCGDGSDYIEPQLLGGPNITVSVDGQGGSIVVPHQSGNTVLYTVISKEVDVVASDLNDLAFSISKSGSGVTSIFSLGFNYEELAKNILNIIASDETLIDLLNEIIGGSLSVDISGLDGKCVINLNSCAYSLIEPSPTQKSVLSIVIDAISYPAPTGLNIRNVSGIMSWLNGLGKGTFTATLNGDSSAITILSTASAAKISTISFSLSGNTLIRTFNKNCGSVAQVLQALIDKICGLSITTFGTKLSTDLEITGGGSFAAGSSLDPFLVALNTKLNSILAGSLKGDKGDDGISVQIFVQPSEPTGGSYRNGDIWIVQ